MCCGEGQSDRTHTTADSDEPRVFFVSDFHFGAESPAEERAKARRFLSFLRHLPPTTQALYIVGDFFDFWFEYRHVVPRAGARAVAELARLAESGLRVMLIGGNHDYWLGDFLRDEMGLAISRQPASVEHFGQRVFLHHGDGVNRANRGYRLLKWFLRHPVNERLFRLLHPDWGARLAHWTARSSRDFGAKDHFAMDGWYPALAREVFARGVTGVVLGHLHQPLLLPLEGGWLAVLGDWMKHNTYLEMTPRAATLARWPSREVLASALFEAPVNA